MIKKLLAMYVASIDAMNADERYKFSGIKTENLQRYVPLGHWQLSISSFFFPAADRAGTVVSSAVVNAKYNIVRLRSCDNLVGLRWPAWTRCDKGFVLAGEWSDSCRNRLEQQTTLECDTVGHCA